MTVIAYTEIELLYRGLTLIGFENDLHRRPVCNATKRMRFKSCYGSRARTLARLWEELQTTEVIEARFNVLQHDDVDRFLMTHYFLNTYSTRSQLAGIFGSKIDCSCERTVGKWCWLFIRKMSALKTAKIVWPAEWDTNADTVPIFLYTVDGTHCWTREKQHPEFPYDRKLHSHKFKRSGVDYEIGLSLWEPKIVWCGGPHKASMNDITIFRMKGLMQRTPAGKRAIADGGYQGEAELISIPNQFDSKELRRFKRRARARHEALNGKIKSFGILNQRFRHSLGKHKAVFMAVLVIVQYQLDNGEHPLFNV